MVKEIYVVLGTSLDPNEKNLTPKFIQAYEDELEANKVASDRNMFHPLNGSNVVYFVVKTDLRLIEKSASFYTMP
jgi:hypothetical protein